jgi:lantibiotic modifying enzyme
MYNGFYKESNAHRYQIYPLLAKWISPTIMKVTDYFDGVFNSIFEDEKV